MLQVVATGAYFAKNGKIKVWETQKLIFLLVA